MGSRTEKIQQITRSLAALDMADLDRVIRFVGAMQEQGQGKRKQRYERRKVAVIDDWRIGN